MVADIPTGAGSESGGKDLVHACVDVNSDYVAENSADGSPPNLG